MRMYLAAAIGTALLAATFKLYGPVWLVLVSFFGSLLVGCFGVWVGWGLGVDHAAEEAARLERHTHREGDPAPGTLIQLPMSGRLAVEPDPGDWRFAGEPAEGWAAEYERLTQTADDDPFGPDAYKSHRPGCVCPDCRAEPAVGSLDWAAQRLAEVRADEEAEPLTDTGEMRALGDRVVAKLEGDTNEWIFANVLRTTT